MSIPEMRKAQEELVNFVVGGYYKAFTKAQKAVFDSYISLNFTREESLKLTITFFSGKNNSNEA